MAKLSLQRLLEVSRLLATEAGQQLQDLLTFTNDLADQVLRALRQGLTFQDNFNCLVRQYTIQHQTDTLINTDGKRPYGVIPVRVVSETIRVGAINWHIDSTDQTFVNISFENGTESYAVVLIVLFN